MLIGRHGEHLEEPVGELDQVIAVVREKQVRLLAPLSLAGQHFLEYIPPFLPSRQSTCLPRCCFHVGVRELQAGELGSEPGFLSSA
jgi:hypothetical protein